MYITNAHTVREENRKMVKRTKTILAAAVTAAAAGCMVMPVSAEQAKVDIFQNKSEIGRAHV